MDAWEYPEIRPLAPSALCPACHSRSGFVVVAEIVERRTITTWRCSCCPHWWSEVTESVGATTDLQDASTE
jgi:hypothetical protein